MYAGTLRSFQTCQMMIHYIGVRAKDVTFIFINVLIRIEIWKWFAISELWLCLHSSGTMSFLRADFSSLSHAWTERESWLLWHGVSTLKFEERSTRLAPGACATRWEYSTNPIVRLGWDHNWLCVRNYMGVRGPWWLKRLPCHTLYLPGCMTLKPRRAICMSFGSSNRQHKVHWARFGWEIGFSDFREFC